MTLSEIGSAYKDERPVGVFVIGDAPGAFIDAVYGFGFDVVYDGPFVREVRAAGRVLSGVEQFLSFGL